MEYFLQRAARIAGANAPKARSGRAPGGDLGKRLAAYHEAVQTPNAEPPCPDCWMHLGEQLSMTPIKCDEVDEDLFGCMECGFEAHLPARPGRRHWTRQPQPTQRKRARAA